MTETPQGSTSNLVLAAEIQKSHIAFYTREINALLEGDADLTFLPLDPNSTTDLPLAGTKGVLLCKLINRVKNGTIPAKNFKVKPRNVYEIIENQNESIRGAIALGCKVVNITAIILMDEKKPTALLGLVWQILRYHLVNSISVKDHPEMMRLLQKGEDLGSFIGLSPEQRLLRWVNHHLRESGYAKAPVTNFKNDWVDGEAFVHLLHQLNSALINKGDALEAKGTQRFDHVVGGAEKLGIKTFKSKDLGLGDEVLTIAFVASLFHANPSLAAVESNDAEKKALSDAQDLLAEKERQAEEARKKQEEEWNAEIARKSKEIEEQAKEWREKHALLESRESQLQIKEAELQEKSRQLEEELARQKEELERQLREQKEKMEAEIAKAKEEAAAEINRSRGNTSNTALNINVEALDATKLVKVLRDIPDQPVRKLYITVTEGKDLIQCDIGSESDPYVVLEHYKAGSKKPVAKFKTKVIMDNQRNPHWYETMEFRNFAMTDYIRMRVWDYDLTGKDFMGEVNVERKDIVNGSSKWFNLGPRPTKPKQKIHGCIGLEFECFYNDLDNHEVVPSPRGGASPRSQGGASPRGQGGVSPRRS